VFIRVTADRSVLLDEHDNFKGFKLVVDGSRQDIESVRAALDGIAELPDAETAWVSEAALRSFASVATDTAWQQALSAMIEKAKPHGWIDESRRAIKAHVEWAG
jgi:hypothetical protein